MRIVRARPPRPRRIRLGLGRGRAGCARWRPVTLKAIKAEPALAEMELLRQSRLSVAPVRDEEWAKVLEMSEAAAGPSS